MTDEQRERLEWLLDDLLDAHAEWMEAWKEAETRRARTRMRRARADIVTFIEDAQ